MCGIYGYLSFEKSIGETIYHEVAVDKLFHRGPDEVGYYQSDCIFLGMRRLSIIDISSGSQPIWNEDRSMCIVYNGELYNYLDIRPELEARGHVFSTDSDTEVILHSYEEWGVSSLNRFNGMFSFAIWEVQSQKLIVARDRIGEKPLYYYYDSEKIAFASEIKALVSHPTIPRRLCDKGLVNFLAFGHAVAPNTIYENIFKLPSGHYMIVQDGNIDIKCYWDIRSIELSNAPELELKNQIIELLSDSVRRRMIADVPVGAFLSGGVDSASVVSLMRQHTSTPIKTFSLGFEVGGAYNELSEARQVADYLGTEHHELTVGSVDLIDTLKKLIYHYDEPFGDAASFPIYLLSQFARQHVKVVLTGDGGDELFGGYRRYMVDQWASLYQRLPRTLIEKVLPHLADALPRLRRVKRALNTLSHFEPSTRYAKWLTWFSPELREKLLHKNVQNKVDGYDPSWPYPEHYHALNGENYDDHLNRLMYVDLKTWLVDVYMEKTDKATMAASLEARIPLLDYRLVELAFQIPSRHKIRRLSTKVILKQAVRDLVPRDVLKRPKHGFAVPTDPWFRGQLKSFAFEVLLDPSSRNRGYFNSEFIEQLWREHETGRHVWDTQLWLLLNFELWHRIYLDNEGI